MTERVIDVVPGMVRGRKRDGHGICDRRAKQVLFDTTVSNQRELLETAQGILAFLREND